jgi:hypothetical protein
VIKHLLPCLSTLIVAAASAASPTIERLAPENSIVVASVDDFQQAMTRFKQTGMWALWKSDEIQAMVTEPIEQFKEELDELLEELELEGDDLVQPQGPVGFAFFGPDRDDPESKPGFLLVADFGTQAHKFNRVVDALMEKARTENDIEFDESKLLGRTVYTLDLSQIEVDEELDMDEDEFGGMSPVPDLPGAEDVMDTFDKLHYVRDGRRFLLCSDMAALHRALEVIDEDGRTRLGERTDFQGARAQVGPADAYAVLLMKPMWQALGGVDPSAMMIQAMVQSIVGDIRALALGVRFSGESAMVEETFGVYMPDGTAGLTALADTATPRRDIPEFVGPDSIAYSRVNFEFNGIPAFIRTLGQLNPMLGPQIDQFMFDYGATVEKVCNALGPEVYSVVRLTRPIDLASLKTLYAIKTSRPDEVESVLAEYAPMLHLEPRDFVGRRIYTMPFDPFMMAGGGMMPQNAEGFSIGFSGGHVFLGTTTLVEDALRVGGKDMPTLADDSDVADAIAALDDGEMVGWGVMDVVDYLEYFAVFGRLMDEQMIEQMKEWDPEYAEEMRQEMEARGPSPWEKLDPALLREYIGPVSWQIKARDDGFVGKYLLLEPAETTAVFKQEERH